MYIMMSVVSAVKDYIEIVHKFVESDSNFGFQSYLDFGAIITYFIFVLKNFFTNLFSFNWITSIWSIPIIVPDIASSMISEVSVLDGYFHNIFTFLETPISYGNQNIFFYCLEKFTIGIINSFFLCIPTSTAHIITLRRFVMQGLEAGTISGLGTIAGNILWIASIIFGWRFFVIPWLSLDILRYLFGFILLTKYMWDSYIERRTVLEDISKWKIFLLNFLLAFIEQTSIFPFISNITIGSDISILESFPTGNFMEFISIHFCYILGILIGSLSLLQITCWFWENPAFQLYMWMISSFRVTTGLYYKFLNFAFLYITMVCAISNLAYFGLDYTITQPLGFIHEDRIIDQKTLLETAFLGTKASDRNTRRNRGRHGRRERWKRRVRRYRTFDASLYDQGIYDLFTIEDLNYGFDRFWLRRKMRNHRVRFRFFPGPWMRSFKKQLARPRLESFMGPRIEFFRILFEQAYHPSFHEFSKEKVNVENPKFSSYTDSSSALSSTSLIKKELKSLSLNKEIFSLYAQTKMKERTRGILGEISTLRKFVRKVNNRIKMSKIAFNLVHSKNMSGLTKTSLQSPINKPIYSRTWKQLFSKMYINSASLKPSSPTELGSLSFADRKTVDNLQFSTSNANKQSTSLISNTLDGHFLNQKRHPDTLNAVPRPEVLLGTEKLGQISLKNSLTPLSKKDIQILKYRTFLSEHSRKAFDDSINSSNGVVFSNTEHDQKSRNNQSTKTLSKSDYNLSTFVSLKPLTLLHPIQFYLHKEQAFRRKLKFYGSNVYRNLTLENNAPYFRVMMRRFFYYYKPTLRWEQTMRTASLRKARRKGPRIPRRLNINKNIQTRALSLTNTEQIQKPTHFYSLVEKRATRYRYHIYKDVLQHWYYSPFNRLLLKFDVDAFIRRQPFSHFLTKKEEHLLHLRRFLLSEHYNTIRWYTYMQHYRTMKSKIGGTKSLASRVYNQQFQGTFKKIRHLFSITPSLTDNSVLKYDQPLFNEYPNTHISQVGAKHLLEYSILNDSVIHEELLTDDKSYNSYSPNVSNLSSVCEINPCLASPNSSPIVSSSSKSPADLIDYDNQMKGQKKNVFSEAENGRKSSRIFRLFDIDPKDLMSQSTQILREYLITKTPIRQELIKKLLQDNNYSELTNFLYKGQKSRGTIPVTGNQSFLEQEKNIIYTPTEITELNKQQHDYIYPKLKHAIWVSLIKKCYTRLYDQEAQKNYLARRIEKREKRKQIREKHLKNRFQRIKNWVVEKPKNSRGFSIIYDSSGTRDLEKPKLLTINSLSSSALTNGSIASIEKTKANQLSIAERNVELPHVPIVGEMQTSTDNNVFGQAKQSQMPVTTNSSALSLKKAIKEAIFLQQDTKHNKNLLQFPRSRLMVNKKNIFNTIETHLDKRLKTHIYQPIHLFSRGNVFSEAENGRKSKIFDILKNLINKHRDSTFFYTKKRQFRWQQLLKKVDTHFLNGVKHQKPFIGFSKNWFGKSASAIFNKKKHLLLYVESNKNDKTNEQKDIQFQRLKNWRKKERALTKRKKTRKRMKRLKKKKIRAIDIPLIADYRNLKENVFSIAEDSRKAKLFDIRKKRDIEGPKSLTILNEAMHPSNVGFSENKPILSFNTTFELSKRKTWEKWVQKLKEQKNSKQIILNGNLQKTRIKPLELFSSALQKTFTKNFKTKPSRRRRSRRMRPRGAIRKRSLGDKLKRQFKILRKYSAQMDRQDQKTLSLKTVFQMITGKNYKPANEFWIKEPKQRRALHRKHLFWKKHKRPIYAQNRRKKRKRKRNAIGKIRGLNKQLKRKQNEFQIKKWWWHTFLPNLQGMTSAFWQSEKNKQIGEKLSFLSSSDLLKRDFSSNYKLNEKVPGEKSLQIGDRDYKPLAIPEALRIRENLINVEKLRFTDDNHIMRCNIFTKPYISEDCRKAPLFDISDVGDKEIVTFGKPNNPNVFSEAENGRKSLIFDNKVSGKVEDFSQNLPSQSVDHSQNHIAYSPLKAKDVSDVIYSEQLSQNVVSKLYQNTFNRELTPFKLEQSKFVIGINPIPFYAGWDETLRKFVVTNRLLSRQEAGYELNFKPLSSNNKSFLTTLNTHNVFSEAENGRKSKIFDNPTFKMLIDKSKESHIEFSHFPLKGMNAATTLYWQIPFTTYDPDQFFALGMDGFSPVGWKRFNFRYSTQTAKPLLVKTKTLAYQITNNKLEKNELLYNIKMKFLNWKQLNQSSFVSFFKSDKSQSYYEKTKKISYHRRIKKRYRRVKKHPRPPVWFPSGPLLSQVLPVHYIYVFYKRYRLPRDRYIRRRFRRGKKGIPQVIRDIQFKFTDFTLKRRVKPRRRYHRKRSVKKIENLYPRRRQFKDFPFEENKVKSIPMPRVRPIARKRTTQQLQDLRLAKIKSKQRRKTSTYKQQPDNIRIRQLRRRVQRQVIRPIWRYRPRAGGFVWPGDYLRLDLVKSPKLKKKQSVFTEISVTKKDKKELILKQIRRKKKRNIQEWQIQPKRYLLQKHNMKVIKKRLEKAQRVNLINQKIVES